jgi:hypothetical protein
MTTRDLLRNQALRVERDVTPRAVGADRPRGVAAHRYAASRLQERTKFKLEQWVEESGK